MAPDRVRYVSSAFEAELEMTYDDIVTRYGGDLWAAVRVEAAPDR